MINKDELLYKISFIIKYLEHHGGHNVKLYNHLCPATDVKNMIIALLDYISELGL